MAVGAQAITDSKLQAVDATSNDLFFTGNAMAIGAGAAGASAKFQVDSTTRGVLVPRMTNAQRVAIVVPATGLLVFCTDATAGFYYYTGVIWQNIGTGTGTVTSTAAFFNQIPLLTTVNNITNSGLTVNGTNWVFPLGVNLAVQQLQGNGTAPTIAAGTNATAASIAGSDLGGNFTFTWAAVIAANTQIVRITFNQAFATAPKCILIGPATNVGANSRGVAGIHVDLASITTTQFDVFTSTDTSGITILTNQSFYYIIVQ